MLNNQSNFYEGQLLLHQEKLQEAKKKHRYLSMGRLFAFLLIVLTWFLMPFNVVLLLVVAGETALFVLLVNRWLDAKLEKERCELFIQLNQHELAALNGDWSNFPDGASYKSAQHPYATDMDLFGPKSVYQYINRTVLPLGAERLAATLAQGAHNKQLNQQMIEELSHQMEWNQRFIVQSKVYLKNDDKQQGMAALKEVDFGSKWISYVRFILPVVTIGSLVLNNLEIISTGITVLIGLLCMMVIGTQLKITNKWMHLLSHRQEKIAAMNEQLTLFRGLKFSSQEGQQYQAFLDDKSGMKEGLSELLTIRKRAEYRMNAIVGLLLNYLFAWDFHVMNQSRKWHAKHQQELAQWEGYLAEIEVWISGAIYKFNRGNTCFAAQDESGEAFEIKELSHPFIAVNKQIPNDFSLVSDTSFLIITGPNMAGKSTYLRSVGLAVISANAGFPILAKSCRLGNFKLYTSMRTSDDLTVESSYFHAELTRLRYIMNAIEAGEKVFVILDEILKGTNSKDKEQGSARFLQKLNKLGAKGIIATHDLSLTDLSKKNPSFRNIYFDSTITGDDLFFDYKVREGVCKNMNASFLLKQMKLVDEVEL